MYFKLLLFLSLKLDLRQDFFLCPFTQLFFHILSLLLQLLISGFLCCCLLLILIDLVCDRCEFCLSLTNLHLQKFSLFQKCCQILLFLSQNILLLFQPFCCSLSLQQSLWYITDFLLIHYFTAVILWQFRISFHSLSYIFFMDPCQYRSVQLILQLFLNTFQLALPLFKTDL